MSSDNATAPSAQQQGSQPHQKPRKPPLSDWPTIKILTPPQGRFSPKKDEWCFSMCTQSIYGRAHGKEPECRSICLRKVFPHEVKNILSYSRHAKVGPDGKAKYPLPEEGQPSNLPPILGGVLPVDEDEGGSKASEPPTKYWEEGWYLWKGNTRQALDEKTTSMRLSLENQHKLHSSSKGGNKELPHDGQRTPMQGDATASVTEGLLSPTEDAILVPFPPDVAPLFNGMRKLLAPSMQALGIFRESFTSGEHKEFFKRAWEKAKTDEPFILAQRTMSTVYDTWKKRDAVEDDGKKGST